MVQKEQGNASLSPGDKEALRAISEFGAKSYTEDEQRELRHEKPILDEILFLHLICDEVEKTEEPVLLVQQVIDCETE